MTHGLESNYVAKGKTFLFSLNIIHEQQFTLYIYRMLYFRDLMIIDFNTNYNFRR